MNYFSEIEKALVGEIEALADPAPNDKPELIEAAVKKAHAMSELTGSYIELQSAAQNEMRVKIEAVKVAMSAEGYAYQKFLGVEEDKSKRLT